MAMIEGWGYGSALVRGMRSAGHHAARWWRLRTKSLAEQYPQWDIGAHSYGWIKVVDFGDGSRLRIGDYCSMATGIVMFLGGEHRADWVTTYPFPAFRRIQVDRQDFHLSKGDISIGSDVWIGARAMVLSGTTIGHGCVIGAGSVVAGDLPPYSIAAGNPCRVVRSRFSPDEVADLLEIAWWDWPAEKVDQFIPVLLSQDIAAFIRAAKSA